MNVKNNTIYIILALFTTFLFADRFMIYGVAVLIVMFLLLSGRNLVLYTTPLIKALIAILIVTLLVMALSFMGFSSIYSSSVALKEIYRCIIYILILNMMLGLEVNLKTYSFIWRVILIFIVGIAIIQWTKIIDIDSILKSIYGDSVQFYNSAKTDIASFRCGSVFINPNVFACFLVAELASYLFLKKHIRESAFMQILTYGLIMTGFILCGSRTGLLLAIIIIIVDLFQNNRDNISLFIRDIIFLLFGVAALLGILVLVLNVQLSDFNSFRLFQVKAGTSDSLGIKLSIYGNLIKNMNPLNLLLGYGPFAYASQENLLVDFDFGYFTTFYGIAGLFIYIALIHGIYTWGDNGLAGRRLLNKMFVVIAIFFGITAGVYFNLRIFSIYMLLFLPTIYVEDEIVA